MLSRNPIAALPMVDEEQAVEYTTCFILKGAPLSLEMVAHETAKDTVLLQVIREIETFWKSPTRAPELQAYYTMCHELTVKVGRLDCVESELVMQGDQVLIPSALGHQLLVQVHEGHVGAKKMHSVLQAYAFWLGCSWGIVAFFKRCSACTVYQIKLDTPPLVPIAEKAETPYEVVSVDLTGPSATLHWQVLLTMIDYYSRYPEVFILKRGDTKEILTCLRHVFARMAFQPLLSVTMGWCFGQLNLRSVP